MIKLSPSAAKRWMYCTASPALEARLLAEGRIKRTFSIHADQGTDAALVAERILTGGFSPERIENIMAGGDPNISQHWKPEWTEPMRRYIEAVAELHEWVGELDGTFVVEEKIQAFYGGSGLIPDAVIFSPTRLAIMDLKWGVAVEVPAEKNPQLVIGAVSIAKHHKLEFMDDTPVRLAICQPRHRTGPLNPVWDTTWGEVIAEARKIKQAVDTIQSGAETRFYPESTVCQFCLIGEAGLCPARNGQTEALTKPVTGGFALAEVDDAQKALILSSWKDIKDTVDSWAEDFLARGLAGETLPAGMYVGVSKGGHRKWADDAERQLKLQVLGAGGDDSVLYEPRELKSPAQVEELKPKLKLDGLTTKSPGKPKLSFAESGDPAFENKATVAPSIDL
jgi:hypothetical protein